MLINQTQWRIFVKRFFPKRFSEQADILGKMNISNEGLILIDENAIYRNFGVKNPDMREIEAFLSAPQNLYDYYIANYPIKYTSVEIFWENLEKEMENSIPSKPSLRSYFKLFKAEKFPEIGIANWCKIVNILKHLDYYYPEQIEIANS